MKNNPYTAIATGFAILILIVLVREILIRGKRRMRRAELRHYIAMIQDPDGCGRALSYYYAKCKHINEYYRVKLSEAGYNGELLDLKHEAERSEKLHKQKGKDILSRFQTHQAAAEPQTKLA